MAMPYLWLWHARANIVANMHSWPTLSMAGSPASLAVASPSLQPPPPPLVDRQTGAACGAQRLSQNSGALAPARDNNNLAEH